MSGVKGMKRGVKFGAARHGIHATYARGCRCEECREAWRVERKVKEAVRRSKWTPEQRAARVRAMQEYRRRKKVEKAQASDGA